MAANHRSQIRSESLKLRFAGFCRLHCLQASCNPAFSSYGDGLAELIPRTCEKAALHICVFWWLMEGFHKQQ